MQNLLGHAQVQTTINTYVHIIDKKHMESYKQAIREQKKEV
ncbi:hypothetical protein MMJ63_26970 [Bacillus vallismortis]|nr:hypothetical protein [Bacillus vallismortis]